MEKIVVAVIGGSGFLGQHIVRELQVWNNENKNRTNGTRRKSSPKPGTETLPYVSLDLNHCNKGESDDTDLLDDNDDALHSCDVCISEIRILDIKPFEPFFELSDYPLVSVHPCDIRYENHLTDMLNGATVVVHCAAVSDHVVTLVPGQGLDEDAFWETNLEGTENVVSACKRNNVRALIYTSTVSAVMGRKMLVSHTETLTPVVDETKLLMGPYARSRKRAEDVVLNAHNTSTQNDIQMVTTVLRPVLLYGEGDTHFIPSLIDMAKKAGGKLPALGGPFAYHQLTYAGNAAYAHVCAMTHLLHGASHPLRDCGGLPTYISDDSPTGTSDEVLRPFLNNFGLSTTTPSLPLFIVLAFTFVASLWVTFWERVGFPSRWAAAVPSPQLQNLAGTTTVVSRVRAEVALHFKPKYSWEEAKMASLSYYETLADQSLIKCVRN